MQVRWATVAALLTSLATPLPATALEFAPHKDALYAYGEMTAALDGGRLLDVPYSEAKDIDARDEIPERRAHRRYVDLRAVRDDREIVVETAAGAIRTRQVGVGANPATIVVFVHGKGGNAELGMNDWTFGGNFNRLKNLVVAAGGLYVTVDGGLLGDEETRRVGALVSQLAATSAPVVLACGSLGGSVCWRLGAERAVAADLLGLVLLGASSTPQDFAEMARRRDGSPIPILLAHGSRDRVYTLAAQRSAYDAARATTPERPLRMVVFDGGTHGTPIRMIDWRDTLNWIHAQD